MGFSFEDILKQLIIVAGILVSIGSGAAVLLFGMNKGRKQLEKERSEIIEEKDEQFDELKNALKENLLRIKEENEEMKKSSDEMKKELERMSNLIKKQTVEINKLKKDLEIYYCANAPTCAKNSRRAEDIEKTIEI